MMFRRKIRHGGGSFDKQQHITSLFHPSPTSASSPSVPSSSPTLSSRNTAPTPSSPSAPFVQKKMVLMCSDCKTDDRTTPTGKPPSKPSVHSVSESESPSQQQPPRLTRRLSAFDSKTVTPLEVVQKWTNEDWNNVLRWLEVSRRCDSCGSGAKIFSDDKAVVLLSQLGVDFCSISASSTPQSSHRDGGSIFGSSSSFSSCVVPGAVSPSPSSAGKDAKPSLAAFLPYTSSSAPAPNRTLLLSSFKEPSQTSTSVPLSVPLRMSPSSPLEEKTHRTFESMSRTASLGAEACPYLSSNGSVREDSHPVVRVPSAPVRSIDLPVPILHSKSDGFPCPPSPSKHVNFDGGFTKKLLTVITKAHDLCLSDNTANGSTVADFLLAQVLELTQSEFGLIASVFQRDDGSPYIKSHAISNLAWTKELRQWYAENSARGLVFSKMDTLYGEVVTTGEMVISNDPSTDPRSTGTPPGHPKIKQFLGIPLCIGSEMIGVVAVMNRVGSIGYDTALVRELQPLVKSTAQIVHAIQKRRSQRERFEKLQNVFRVISEGLISVSSVGKISSVNPAGRQIFGLSPIRSSSSSSSLSSSSSFKDITLLNSPDEVVVESPRSSAFSHAGTDAMLFKDMFFSVDSREDFMADDGLDSFVGRTVPALGRKMDGSTLFLELSISKGTAEDVTYVALVRQIYLAS